VQGGGAAYDPRAALEFFRGAGKPQRIAAGATIFAEKEKGLFKRSRIYLVLDGEVSLLSGRKPIAAVKAGEVFGEVAAIKHAPRTATAIAKTACKVISLDDKEFQAALRKTPAFALMLMSVMIQRLRESIAHLLQAGALTEGTAAKESAAFDPKHLGKLLGVLSDEPPIRFDRSNTILQAGQAGLLMYVVAEGSVAVKIGEHIVERLGPGGAFGEAALVAKSTRLASAVALTDCALLPITRNAFLGLVKTSPGFTESMLSSLAERLRFLTSRMK
jgi:CRP-like cAMP-binding protein